MKGETRKKKMGFAKLCIWNVRDLLRREKKKDGVSQVVDLKLTKNIKGKQKKKGGLDEVVYLNDERFTIRTKEKKDGVDWIVDLKISKILKGKWEKKWWVLPNSVFEM